VFAGSLNRRRRVAAGLEVGMVGIDRGMVSNAAIPFGGVSAQGSAGRAGRKGSPRTYSSCRWPARRLTRASGQAAV